jgi:hemoglobin-like flavoprotein
MGFMNLESVLNVTTKLSSMMVTHPNVENAVNQYAKTVKMPSYLMRKPMFAYAFHVEEKEEAEEMIINDVFIAHRLFVLITMI